MDIFEIDTYFYINQYYIFFSGASEFYSWKNLSLLSVKYEVYNSFKII